MDTIRIDPGDRDRKRVTRIVLSVACLLFAIPLIAMQWTHEVEWSVGDFVVWGVLLAGASAAILWAMSRLPRSRRLLAGALVLAIFVYVWAELAVGVFTNLGS
jgi:peptidoglycan/LPS O-acetylase OafA/YrhL